MNNKSYEIIAGDCLEVMDRMIQSGDQQFDLIFADPPYFLSNGGMTCQNGKAVKVDKGDWDKSKGAEANHEFNTEWLKRCQKLLTPNGSIVVSGTHHVIFSVGYAMQQLEMKILNSITWEKPNPPPNLSCRYFTHSTETLIWAAKNKKSKHTFNYPLMREINGGKQMKDVWKFTAPSKEEKRFGKHPTQKPEKLLERIILASTHESHWVLDPFNGSGTTAVASLRHKRNYVGIELDADYIALSHKRIASIVPQQTTKEVSAKPAFGSNDTAGEAVGLFASWK